METGALVGCLQSPEGVAFLRQYVPELVLGVMPLVAPLLVGAVAVGFVVGLMADTGGYWGGRLARRLWRVPEA